MYIIYYYLFSTTRRRRMSENTQNAEAKSLFALGIIIVILSVSVSLG